MMMQNCDETVLLDGEAKSRRDRNRAYLMRLKVEDLLLSHYMEAGLWRVVLLPEQIGHWGWDAPTSQIRGTVVGHFLSAAARIVSETKDMELLAKANIIVREISHCQRENGGEWAFPIPEKYLFWLKNGKRVWAPQYVCHKNMMGLLDMYLFTGNMEALEIVKKCANWFTRFTDDITRENMNEMMELEETGGIMEFWADLYSVTKDERHLELMRRYERPLLFEPIFRGEDVLTNMHANAIIPEIHGAARAYEVTGEERYRKIVENFWSLTVTMRGMYATGGQTSGEILSPMEEQAARLGDLNQEHCVVYNMMRLADYLFRWTGNSEYADYWERNLLNGIFAQGYWEGGKLDNILEGPFPSTGLISYFLPLRAGSQKKWGSETRHFWCCHCTLMQANANVNSSVFYKIDEGLVIAQYISAETSFNINDTMISLTQTISDQCQDIFRISPPDNKFIRRPNEIHMHVKIKAETPVKFCLKLREPEWIVSSIKIYINGSETVCKSDGSGFVRLEQEWSNDDIKIVLPKGLRTWPLPDRPDMVAFMDGPVVLAGLVSEERILNGDLNDLSSLLVPDDDRHWAKWKTGYKTVGQERGFRLIPLNEIGNEVYTVYFSISNKQ